MPDDFPISLKSWPLKNQDPASTLPTFYQRIEQQRGGFRNVTEESLRQEIAEEEAAAAAGEDNANSDGEKEEEPDRLKALMEAKTEMFHHIQYVYDVLKHAKVLINTPVMLMCSPHKLSILYPFF